MNNKSIPPVVVVVAHAPLAAALRDVAVHVLGEAAVAGSGVAFIDVVSDAPPQGSAARIAAAVGGASEALFLTDLPHATPHNCAVAADSALALELTPSQWQVVTHCTAAMVLRAVQNANAAQPLGLGALVEKLQNV